MEPYAQAAETVRALDRNRYLADLFAPEPVRRHLFALHAFNAEVAGIRDRVSDPILGEIRLQWWRDALTSGEGGGHPVAAALNETIRTVPLPPGALDDLLSARVFDLYDDPMPSLNDLEGYAGETSSSLIQLAAVVLAGGRDPGTATAAGHAGVAYALTGLMRALPVHSARGQCYLPGDLMADHDVDRATLRGGKATPELRHLLADLRSRARNHLADARLAMTGIDPVVKPAFLPLALVAPALDRMDRADYDPFSSRAELAPWRRQWAIWRAARRW